METLEEIRRGGLEPRNLPPIQVRRGVFFSSACEDVRSFVRSFVHSFVCRIRLFTESVFLDSRPIDPSSAFSGIDRTRRKRRPWTVVLFIEQSKAVGIEAMSQGGIVG